MLVGAGGGGIDHEEVGVPVEGGAGSVGTWEAAVAE
jgi:hypothetical protein